VSLLLTGRLPWARRRLEKAANLGDDWRGFLFEPPVGDPDNAISDGLEACVASPVSLKGCSVVMKGEAIQFDDQPMPGPKGVDLV